MNFGSPVAMMLLFSLIALCCVFFAIPALRSPPPGLKKCPQCKELIDDDAPKCTSCGQAFDPPEDTFGA